MSDIFAEATVKISPSLTGFITDLNTELGKAMKRVKSPVIRVKPGLTRDFVGDLRRQINTAVAQAQKGVKPIVIKTVVQTPSRRALSELVSAPVSLGAVGHITPAVGPVGGASAAEQETINRLLKGNVQLLGLTEVAEEKVAKARQRGSVATKTKESQEARLKRTTASALELEKRLSAIEFEAATATGELAQAKKRLSIANELEKKASSLRAEQVSKETIRVQQLAQAERQLALERVRALEEAGAAAGAGAGGQTAAQRAVARARARAVGTRTEPGDLRTIVTGLRETQQASTSVKDLAGAKALLEKQTTLLSQATKLEKLAITAESDSLKVAAANTRALADTQVKATRAQVEQLKASARSASAEKRRSEQLSRGGQASLLSLAGIRGATLAASRSFLVGAASITVFARAVRQFADLERNLDVFRATTSATAEQMEQVRKEATALGADLTLPSVAAGDAAGAMVELAKAGLSVQDSIAGARGVLELSTAAAIDTADAVRLTANVLNAFSLSGREAITVADTLANAANLAQGSIADIGTAFQQAASAGHQVGLSFQDTATFLTILAKNGLRGSDAGTSLRTALIRLVNPSKEAAAQFEKLGIVLRDNAGNLRPDVFLQIAAATKELGPAQRDATIALIGGQDAFRAVTILGRQSVKSFLAMRAALRQQGTAAELAKARTEGLHGAMDGLQSVLETVGTTAAGHVGPALADFVRTISTGITAFSENQQVASTLSQALDTVANSFKALGAVLQGVGGPLLKVLDTMVRLANAVGGTQLVASIAAATLAMKTFQAVLNSSAITSGISGLKALSTAYKSVGVAAEAAAVASTTAISPRTGAPLQAAAGVEKTAAAAGRAAIGLRGLAAAGNVAFAAMGGWVTVAIAAAGALFFLSQRETAAERASRQFREETEKLAGALDRAKEATDSLQSAQRAAKTSSNAVEQAKINRENAQIALSQGSADPRSSERRQLLLNVAIATQDVTFAIQDQKKALEDLAKAREADNAALGVQSREQNKARDLFDDLVRRAQKFARAPLFGGTALQDLTQEARSRRVLTAELRKQAAAEADSENETVRSIATRKRLIALIIDQSKIPLDKLLPKLDKIFSSKTLEGALSKAAPLFAQKGKEAQEAFVQAVVQGFLTTGNLAKAIADALGPGVVGGTETAFSGAIQTVRDRGIGFRLGSSLGEDAAAGFKATFTISDIVATATAQGLSDAQILARLQSRLPGAQNRFNRLNKATKGGTVFKSQDQRDAFDAARDELNDINNEIDRLTGEISSAQKDTQQKIVDAQKERDTKGQAIVDSLLEGRKATLLQRKITSAGLTAWLGDDLKTNTLWLNYLKNLKKVLLARLKAVGASKQVIHDAMQAISDLIFSTTNEIKRINTDIEKNAKDRQDALNDVLFQKIDLRIQIAQAREDVAAEIRLRRQKLALITKELIKLKNAHKKNTVEWLELKLEQQQEIAAIKDLQKTQQERNRAGAQLAFEFLQTQQGFAANLLGNLLPMGSFGGTVGAVGGAATINTGGASKNIGSLGGFTGREPGTGGAFPGKTGTTSGPNNVLSRTGEPPIAGPTRGQQTVELDLLRQILRAIQHLNGATKHPENKARNRQNATSFDGHK